MFFCHYLIESTVNRKPKSAPHHQRTTAEINVLFWSSAPLSLAVFKNFNLTKRARKQDFQIPHGCLDSTLYLGHWHIWQLVKDDTDRLSCQCVSLKVVCQTWLLPFFKSLSICPLNDFNSSLGHHRNPHNFDYMFQQQQPKTSVWDDMCCCWPRVDPSLEAAEAVNIHSGSAWRMVSITRRRDMPISISSIACS